MKVWEPLPIDEGHPRPMRAGLLAQELAEAGHRVTWWALRFEHFTKTLRPQRGTVPVSDNLRIVLLEGPTYRRNVSLRRIANNLASGLDYLRQGLAWPDKPDVIVCALPTVELAFFSVLLGKRFGAPVVIDSRDKVPDIYVEVFQQRTRLPGWLVAALAFPYEWMVHFACRHAASLTAISRGFLGWALGKAGRPEGPRDRVFYPTYRSLSVPAHPARSGPFTVFFAGILTLRILEPMKVVFEAVRRLDRVHLVVCGSGEADREMLELAGDCPRIRFTGRVGLDCLESLMRESQVGLLPYPNDSDFLISIPGKVAEYLAGGLPIVSSLGGEVGDLVREQGCGFVYRDSAELAAGLLELMDENRLAPMQARARELFARSFCTEVVSADFRRHLESLVERRQIYTSEVQS
ncbi:MAG: glycosyltransferase [Candidatus Eremiobacterota bacterium]